MKDEKRHSSPLTPGWEHAAPPREPERSLNTLLLDAVAVPDSGQ